jgi:hypothetical protein
MDSLHNPTIQDQKKKIDTLVEEFHKNLSKLQIEQDEVINNFIKEHELQKIDDLRNKILNM